MRLLCHLTNEYVFEISKTDKEFIDTIVDKLLDYKENLNYEILSGLWKQNNSYELADRIFNKICCSNSHLFLIQFWIEHVFLLNCPINNDNDIFLVWANEKIKSISDDKSIKLLAELVSRCSGELTYKFYSSLIEKHIDAKLFADVLYCPSSYSWSGSEVNAYVPKISKLKDILSHIPDSLECLEYKTIVEDYISQLERAVKKSQNQRKNRF